MGINSTEVSYSFGQLGSGYLDDTSAFTPPSGKVIIGIKFLQDTELAALTADIAQGDDAAFIGFATVTGNGTNADDLTNNALFPAGMTIYGRWTNVQLKTAQADGGIICYFGE